MKKDREEIKNTMQMIGKRIRFHRRAADITQEELALGISCSASYISNLESGHARINVLRLIQIAEFLKVDAGERLSGVTPNTNNFLAPDFSEALNKMTDEDRLLLRDMADAILRSSERRKGASAHDDI